MAARTWRHTSDTGGMNCHTSTLIARHPPHCTQPKQPNAGNLHAKTAILYLAQMYVCTYRPCEGYTVQLWVISKYCWQGPSEAFP